MLNFRNDSWGNRNRTSTRAFQRDIYLTKRMIAHRMRFSGHLLVCGTNISSALIGLEH